MDKNKFWTITISSVIILIAIFVAVGGTYLLITNKERIVKLEQEMNRSEDLQAYTKDTKAKIKDNWKVSYDKPMTATISYTINKDGTLKEYKILKSSGLQKFDDEAVQALNKSVPFEPLPKSYDKDSIDVQFTFDYKMPTK